MHVTVINFSCLLVSVLWYASCFISPPTNQKACSAPLTVVCVLDVLLVCWNIYCLAWLLIWDISLSFHSPVKSFFSNSCLKGLSMFWIWMHILFAPIQIEVSFINFLSSLPFKVLEKMLYEKKIEIELECECYSHLIWEWPWICKVKLGCVLLPKYGISIVHLVFVCHHACILSDVFYNFINHLSFKCIYK